MSDTAKCPHGFSFAFGCDDCTVDRHGEKSKSSDQLRADLDWLAAKNTSQGLRMADLEQQVSYLTAVLRNVDALVNDLSAGERPPTIEDYRRTVSKIGLIAILPGGAR